MIHIVFQEADAFVLQKAFELDNTLQGEIIEIRDDYAVGPIADNFTETGWQARKEFWIQAVEHSPYTDQLNMVNDRMTVHQLKEKLDENEPVWIWMAQNAHDICGYYWLVRQLKKYQGQVYVLFLNNLPFINEKGSIFYPTYLHEIQPKEFLKAKKLAKLITLSEFETDPDEWDRLSQANAMVRILEGGKKIAGRDSQFFDKDILQHVQPAPVKLNKLIQTILQKMNPKTGDVFLVWRLKQLAAEGQIQFLGDWQKGWKDISVCLAGVHEEAKP